MTQIPIGDDGFVAGGIAVVDGVFDEGVQVADVTLFTGSGWLGGSPVGAELTRWTRYAVADLRLVRSRRGVGGSDY